MKGGTTAWSSAKILWILFGPVINIFISLNIILTEITAVLYDDQFHIIMARILKTMRGSIEILRDLFASK
jgi:hypothetical protein